MRSTVPTSPAGEKKRRIPVLLGVLLSLFVVIGGIGVVVVAADWIQGLDTWSWRPAACTITRSEAPRRPAAGGYRFEVRYRYEARGEERSGNTYRRGYDGSDTEAPARVLASRYPVGARVSCWVDPDDPDRSALRRSDLWQGLWIFVPLLFVVVGAGAFWLYRNQDVLGAAVSGAGRRHGKPAGKPKFVGWFFGLFLVMGLIFLVPFFLWPLYQMAEARSWKETPCEVLSASVRTHTGDDSTTYSIEVLYRYEVGGREYLSDRYDFMSGSSSGYESKAQIVKSLGPPGTVKSCYVDSRNPEQAVMNRGLRPDLLFGLIPLVFVVVGAGGTWAAISTARGARKAAERPSWGEPVVTPRSDAYPGSVELEPALGPVGKLIAAIVFTLIWNGVLVIFVWQFIETWRTGSTDWLLGAFLVPFVIVGLLCMLGVPYALLALLNPRPRLRLSRAALRPGEPAQVEWSFRGNAGRIERLRLRLRAFRSQTPDGGSRTTASRPFETIEIFDRRRGLGLEFGAASLEIPADAPASGDDPEEGVVWKLQLRGEIPFWPDVNEEFEVEVLEAPSRADT